MTSRRGGIQLLLYAPNIKTCLLLFQVLKCSSVRKNGQVWLCRLCCTAQGYGSQMYAASLGSIRRLRMRMMMGAHRGEAHFKKKKKKKRKEKSGVIRLRQIKWKGTYLNGDLWLCGALFPSGWDVVAELVRSAGCAQSLLTSRKPDVSADVLFLKNPSCDVFPFRFCIFRRAEMGGAVFVLLGHLFFPPRFWPCDPQPGAGLCAGSAQF